jgi:hypothetical protein
MAEETLVKEALTEEMIQAGSALLANLDRSQFFVDAALWLYMAEMNQWRLLLATPEVHLDGPRKAYKRLIQALRNAAAHVSPQDIAVVDTRDAFIQLLRKAVSIEGGHGVRFSRNTIDGQFIEDAYIYRTAA